MAATMRRTVTVCDVWDTERRVRLTLPRSDSVGAALDAALAAEGWPHLTATLDFVAAMVVPADCLRKDQVDLVLRAQDLMNGWAELPQSRPVLLLSAWLIVMGNEFNARLAYLMVQKFPQLWKAWEVEPVEK